MKNSNIPKPFFVFGGVFAAFVIFIFVVLTPLFKNIPKYETDHASAVSAFKKYDDTLQNAQAIEKRIADLTKSYEEKQEQLFVDSSQSIEDLQSIFKELNINMINLTRGVGVADSLGTISTAGYPLYSTSLNFSYVGSMDTTKKLLNYLEVESKGCYFVNTLNLTPGEGSDMYNVSFNVTLYYFDTSVMITTAPETTEAGK